MFRTALTIAFLFVASPVVAAAEPVGDRVEVNGMQMYYEVSGAGDPLIEPFLKGETPKGFFQ